MSVALSQRPWGKRSIRSALPWIGMGLCVASFTTYLAYERLFGKPIKSGPATPAAQAAEQDGGGKAAQRPPGRVNTVTLDESKFAVAKIMIEEVRTDKIATDVSVVGQIQANMDEQVEIRPRSAGIIREVRAKLGQQVKRGEELVTLDSPDIGTARLNLRAKQRELSTTRFEYGWKKEIAGNVALLIPELKRGISERRSALSDDDEHMEQPPKPRGKAPVSSSSTDARVIEKEFANKQLGSYRGTLLQAYADFDIASHEEQKQAYLLRKDIVGEHPALVARHTREGIQAKLEAAIEQVRYDAEWEKRVAAQGVQLAESTVVDAALRLRILGVSEDIQDLLDHADLASTRAREEDVTFYRITAPFDGTIIRKTPTAVRSQKADLNDALFVLADLRSVWVTANVSEANVAKLPKIKDGTFSLSAKAYPEREFSARLLSVGATVDDRTRTVPVLAQAENVDDLFKLGMNVQIHLDSSSTESVLTVPDASVVDIDGQSHVFVPVKNGSSEHIFSPRPVEIGRTTNGRVVITAGLAKGEKVVSSGSFLLKSELILQNQKDEEE
jgi:membrane fusion protein, heavy metal efflux system